MTQRVSKGAEQGRGGGEPHQKQLPSCQTCPEHPATGQSRDLGLGRRRWWWMGVSGDGGSSRKGGKSAGAPQGSPGCQAKSRSKLLLWAQTAFSSSLALAEAPHSRDRKSVV